jgi:hypothetical protein
LTAARLYRNPLPESPQNRGQGNPNVNDYHSKFMEIRSAFRLKNITDWWHPQDEVHLKYTNLSTVACQIFSIMAHGVGVEASYALVQDIRYTQFKITGKALQENVVVRKFVQADNGILVDSFTGLDTAETENYLDLKKAVEERIMHRMAKVHVVLEIKHGSQNLLATPKEFRARNKQMTAI